MTHLSFTQRCCSISALLLLAVILSPADARRRETPQAPVRLVPRADFLNATAAVSVPRISKDGHHLACVVYSDSRYSLVCWDLSTSKRHAVIDPLRMPVGKMVWATDNAHLFLMSRPFGTEDHFLSVVDTRLEKTEPRTLVYITGVNASIECLGRKRPNEVLVTINERDNRYPDLYSVDMLTGKRQLLEMNNGRTLSWYADDSLRVLGKETLEHDGGGAFLVRRHPLSPWEPMLSWGLADGVHVSGFSVNGDALYYQHDFDADLAGCYRRDIATGTDTLLFRPTSGSVVGTVFLGGSRQVLAVVVDYLQPRMYAVAPGVEPSIRLLDSSLTGGVPCIVSDDDSSKIWVVALLRDDGPSSYYLFRRDRGTVEPLFSSYSTRSDVPMVHMLPVTIPTSDGLVLPSYLTVPPQPYPRPYPLVVLVHGGPFARDQWGLFHEVQWLANRGYAVLQVNYRGSVGFGKRFLAAGFRQWGDRMLVDLIEATDWAIRQGIADSSRVGIYGVSYGGYAALAASIRWPDRFRCAVSISAPTGLRQFFASTPEQAKMYLGRMRQVVGDWERDTAFFDSISPRCHAAQMRTPLLMAHGAMDKRVPVAESRQMVDAIRKNGGKVYYMEFPEEMHGIMFTRNQEALQAAAEALLAKYLGGQQLSPTKSELDRMNLLYATDKDHRTNVLELFDREPRSAQQRVR